MRDMARKHAVQAVLVAMMLSGCSAEEVADATALVQDVTDTSSSADAEGNGNDLGSVADSGGSEDTTSEPEDTGVEPEDTGSATEDTATEDVEPELECAADECEIDGECFANQEANPDAPCQRCIVLMDSEGWSNADDLDCDDGDPCTENDGCVQGACAGVAVVCEDDGNPCTSHTCDSSSGDCNSAPADGPCDDGDACTLDDQCADGACVGGAALPCDDGNPCTTDSCSNGECSFEANTELCDDANDCSVDDQCLDGICAGTLNDCDDSNVCTLDFCVEGLGCEHKDKSAVCVDDDECTDEACDPVNGCVFPFNTAPCDDGSECTVDDACSDGECTGPALVVDDNNPCTNDSCDPEVGAVNVNNANPCDDGNACTLGDSCSAGGCTPGKTPKECVDGEQCTDDACDPAEGCVFTNTTEPCEDGTVCTENDVCAGGSCVGDTITCDDEEPCTTDTCDPVEGCRFEIIISNACRPTITVTEPPRGANIQGPLGGTVTVAGTVTEGGAPLTSFTINGEEVAVSDTGEFTAELVANKGGNTIVVDATDEVGGTRKVVQAYLYGATYAKPVAFKSDMVNEAAGNWTSAAAFNDLEPVMAAVFGQFDPTAGLGGGTVFEDLTHKWKVQSVTFDQPVLDITLFDGGMNMKSTINNVKNKMKAECKKVCVPGPFFIPICSCPPGIFDYTADFNIQSLVVTVDVFMSLSESKELVVDIGDVSTDINGLSGGVNIPFGFLFDGLVTFFTNFFKGTMEDQFSNGIQATMEQELQNSFNAFTSSQEFELPAFNPAAPPMVIQAATEFDMLEITPEGMLVVLKMGAYTSQAPISLATKPEHLGYPIGECAEGADTSIIIPQLADLEIVTADDTMNGLMYAGWRAGMMEFQSTPELLATFTQDMPGGADMASMGVEDLEMNVYGMLPPTLSDCVYGTDQPTVHMGDMVFEMSMKLFGVAMDVTMYVTIESGFQLGIGDGLMTFGLTDIKLLEVQTEIAQEELVASEPVLTSLVIDTMMPAFLDSFAGDQAGFPIPELDFGAGASFGIDASTISRLPGYTLITGGVQQ